MPASRPFKWVYIALWLIRVCFALFGTGYIHPDEHMQNGEIAAGDILGLHALKSWEWHPASPVRSIVPAFVTTGVPILFFKLFGSERLATNVQVSMLFRIERLAFLNLSMLLDYSLLSLISSPAHQRLGLLLLASSYVMHTFQVRPFSNSLESVLVALCLVLFQRIVVDGLTPLNGGGKDADDSASKRGRTFKRDLHLLAILGVVGTFTRPTFLAFALPIAYQVLLFSCRVAGSPIRAVALLLPPLCSAALAASGFIVADTYYFRGNFSNPVITPYNFVQYNLSAENLADHGLHPRWLHLSVNLPMMVGPGLLWFTLCSIYEYAKHYGRSSEGDPVGMDTIRQTIIQMILHSLLILSVQPHQELRFLTPLVLPIIVLAATLKRSARPGKLFWASWITFNVLLALVFGFLHQGGVVPSLFSLRATLDDVSSGMSTHIIYWKTYMPPRHLLGVSQKDVLSGKISLTDLAGASQDALKAAFSTPSCDATYLVTPMAMYLSLPEEIVSCTALQKRIFPHLDLDHISETVQAGWYDGLSLGIYAVKRSCTADGPTTGASLK
ncbi:glycosyltransferase family 22 protein [Paxillus involutus ATCC 200175]|uniref:Mannosyltransferase n=1 Tax=Paxillus involutus ATCC 200175 TaxID=664439 RepID=A0A0C9T8N8_PAXIN|nr:glycosyltransferase family 22 protein [Paxillus involutus ATCC 200175]